MSIYDNTMYLPTMVALTYLRLSPPLSDTTSSADGNRRVEASPALKYGGSFSRTGGLAVDSAYNLARAARAKALSSGAAAAADASGSPQGPAREFEPIGANVEMQIGPKIYSVGETKPAIFTNFVVSGAANDLIWTNGPDASPKAEPAPKEEAADHAEARAAPPKETRADPDAPAPDRIRYKPAEEAPSPLKTA